MIDAYRDIDDPVWFKHGRKVDAQINRQLNINFRAEAETKLIDIIWGPLHDQLSFNLLAAIKARLQNELVTAKPVSYACKPIIDQHVWAELAERLRWSPAVCLYVQEHAQLTATLREPLQISIFEIQEAVTRQLWKFNATRARDTV
jgi:hypothetical protein